MSEVPTFKFALTKELITYCEMTSKDPEAWLPKQANYTDTGWDVRCAELVGAEFFHRDYQMIKLGFRVFSPPGWWLALKPRSSSFVKKHIHALYGTIDESYEGEVKFCGQLVCAPGLKQHLFIPFGDKIGQLIPVRRDEMLVESVSNEDFDKLCTERNAKRGSGGFGSTG